MTRQIERRQFLRMGFCAGVLAGLPVVFPDTFGARTVQASERAPETGEEAVVYPRLPEVLDWQGLESNQDLNLVNAVVVPERLMARAGTERVKMAVDFNGNFRNGNPSVLLCDERCDLWGYGESVRDAIGRGQEVSLVLDIPDDLHFSADDLRAYFKAVYRKFNCGKGGVVDFFIGNELNANSKTRADEYLKFYARVIVAAAVVKRDVAEGARLFPYSEAYFGNGEVLDRALGYIQGEVVRYNGDNPLNRLRMGDVVAGIPFHYYDNLTGIRARAEMYKLLASKYGISPTLRLLELGKAEGRQGAELSIQAHCGVIARNMAEAAVLVNEGILDCAFWHTAESIIDSAGHALFVHDGNRFTAKPQYQTYQRMSKLLFSGAVWEEREIGNFDTQVTVRSQTSRGEDVICVWNRHFDLSGTLVTETRPNFNIIAKNDRRDFLKALVGQN